MSENKEIKKECNGCCKEGKECEHKCNGCCKEGKECEHKCGGCCKEGWDPEQMEPKILAKLDELDALSLPLSEIIATIGDSYEERFDVLSDQVDRRSDLLVSFSNLLSGGDGVAASEMMLMATAKVLNDAVVMNLNKGAKNPHNERYVIAQAKRHLDYYFAQRLDGYDDMEMDDRPIIPLKDIKGKSRKEAA